MKENSRDLVFSTVLRLLKETSLFELNISQLKKETGLSTGTFYYHFPNGIEDVLSGLFKKIAGELREQLIDLAMESDSLELTFKKVISQYFTWHSEQEDKSNFLFCVSATGFKDFREIMSSEFSVFSSRMYELFESKAKAEGRKIVDPIIMDAFLLGATRELVHSWIGRGRHIKELEELKKNYLNILFRTCIVS
jgi:AcrR family transcriptional regulator